MKKIIKIGVFVLSLSLANAQEAKRDSAYRPANYQIKVEQFRSFPTSTEDIVFLGNSITAGIDWAELLQNRHVKNRGISGDITFGVLQRLSDITKGYPKKIFILIGTNDLSYNIPNQVIMNNYKRMIDKINKESPSTKIYLQTILPINDEVSPGRNPNNKDIRITQINQKIKGLAKLEKIIIVDLYSSFVKDGKLNRSLTYDGIHLTKDGYRLWEKILRDGNYLN